jgi:hypothetical protein
MARTHMQIEVQALDTLDTASGVNSSIWGVVARQQQGAQHWLGITDYNIDRFS